MDSRSHGGMKAQKSREAIAPASAIASIGVSGGLTARISEITEEIRIG